MAAEITYQREKLSDLWAELQPLLAAHWREIAHYPDIPLDPDKDRYLQIEQAGIVRAFTARTASWRLVGYSVFFVVPSLHYRQSLQANQDVIYVEPAMRSGRVGLGLIQFGDACLRNEGVQLVHQHQKNAHPALGRLLAHLGYEAVETGWMKRLDR